MNCFTGYSLYWIFKGVTFSIAMQYEMNHRISGEDFRRQLLKYQLELMEHLSPAWRLRLEVEIADVLRNHPFRDDLNSDW
ncbi:MAG: hypothetical protein EXR00_08110 [Alphaproteobacteria bacterium]|nr:hypothetical protein [Alphaproteobacteria bacterium]